MGFSPASGLAGLLVVDGPDDQQQVVAGIHGQRFGEQATLRQETDQEPEVIAGPLERKSLGIGGFHEA